MKKNVEITNIDWDTEDCDGEVDLPEEIQAEIEFPEGDDPDEIVCEWLSDEYGFCVNGFSYSLPEEDDFVDEFGEKINGIEAENS